VERCRAWVEGYQTKLYVGQKIRVPLRHQRVPPYEEKKGLVERTHSLLYFAPRYGFP